MGLILQCNLEAGTATHPAQSYTLHMECVQHRISNAAFTQQSGSQFREEDSDSDSDAVYVLECPAFLMFD